VIAVSVIYKGFDKSGRISKGARREGAERHLDGARLRTHSRAWVVGAH
jgi:hypothetical protein